MSNKALVILTSIDKYPDIDKATGAWLGEVVHFVDVLERAGYEIDYVSPRGGKSPIDPASLEMADDTDKEYYNNPDFRNKLDNTLSPERVNPGDYQIVYFAGGHGTVWDFPENDRLQEISRQVYEKGGVVSAVCHGPTGLLNIKLSNGEYLIRDKEVTGFSNEEEKLVEADKHVPYLLEDELKKRQAKYSRSKEPFTSHAVVSERLVTGQNPQSTRAVAESVLKLVLTVNPANKER